MFKRIKRDSTYLNAIKIANKTEYVFKYCLNNIIYIIAFFQFLIIKRNKLITRILMNDLSHMFLKYF